MTQEVDILLVEDNDDDADLAVRALKKSDLAHRLHCVKDGAEALEFLFGTGAYAQSKTSRQPKMILLDLKMPKMDGLEVLKRIRKDERTARIPVVMLTSSRQDRDILDSYKLGANSYIVKPVEFSKFTDVVSQLAHYWLFLNEPPS